jgi:hypothetical protein
MAYIVTGRQHSLAQQLTALKKIELINKDQTDIYRDAFAVGFRSTTALCKTSIQTERIFNSLPIAPQPRKG